MAAPVDQRPGDPPKLRRSRDAVASPTGFAGRVVYSVMAEIQVRSLFDRWLTAVFRPRTGQPLRSFDQFSPGS